jgi:hypothetical protein
VQSGETQNPQGARVHRKNRSADVRDGHCCIFRSLKPKAFLNAK